MEHDTKGGSDPPPTEQPNDDVDMNQAASSAGASEVTALPPSTGGALAPATTQAVEITTASTGPSPGANTSQGKSVWGKGLMVDATQHTSPPHSSGYPGGHYIVPTECQKSSYGGCIHKGGVSTVCSTVYIRREKKR